MTSSVQELPSFDPNTSTNVDLGDVNEMLDGTNASGATSCTHSPLTPRVVAAPLYDPLLKYLGSDVQKNSDPNA